MSAGETLDNTMKTRALIEEPKQRLYVCQNGAIKRIIEQIRTINASTEQIRNHLILLRSQMLTLMLNGRSVIK